VLLALIALAMQMAAAGIVPFAAPVMGLERLVAGSICHSEAGGDRGQAPSHHRAPDCAVCPLCQAIAHAGVLLASPPAAFAAPLLVFGHAFALPPGRAPPRVIGSAASARGPPATI
jgi:hypothetical protein